VQQVPDEQQQLTRQHRCTVLGSQIVEVPEMQYFARVIDEERRIVGL
jgi:hypothetical protein